MKRILAPKLPERYDDMFDVIRPYVKSCGGALIRTVYKKINLLNTSAPDCDIELWNNHKTIELLINISGFTRANKFSVFIPTNKDAIEFAKELYLNLKMAFLLNYNLFTHDFNKNMILRLYDEFYSMGVEFRENDDED